MELVEKSTTIQNDHPRTPKSPHASAIQGEQNGDRAVHQSKSAMGGSKLIGEEVRETGQINFEAYKHYWTESFGWYGVGALMLIALLSQASSMSSDYWMQYETSPRTTFRPSLFIGVYWILTAVSGGFFAMRTFLVSFMGLRTAQRFFNQILHSIMHAPMSFFDTTPSGRILTRGYYLATSREITRLDSITKAPIIHHFSETITGITTIRSFKKQEEFVNENIHRINANLLMEFHNNGSNEWLGFRLELIGSFILCVATMFMIVLPSTVINTGMVLIPSISYTVYIILTDPLSDLTFVFQYHPS